ncbi:MAG: restriction endonuclease [Blastocatellia bacterium]
MPSKLSLGIFERMSEKPPSWELQAEAAVEAILEDIQYDVFSNSVQLDAASWRKGDKEWQRFDEAYDLEDLLRGIAEEVIQMEGPGWWHDTEALDAELTAESVVMRVLDRRGVLDFFDSGGPPTDGSCLISINELADPAASNQIQIDLKTIDDALIEYLARHPKQMYDFSPRKFEELVAELFRGMGYDVVLTPRSRDGGRDLLAFQRSAVGTLLTLVECKHFSPNRRVGVGLIRTLYGVTEWVRASHAVLATTSFFTRGARDLHETVKYRLSLADYDALTQWCLKHRK